MILPICYGELAMTGEEIGRATPWEIERRIEGYSVRMKNRRVFTASFVTAPIVNAGFRAPKKPVTAEKILPGDFNEKQSPKERKEWLEMARREEERRER